MTTTDLAAALIAGVPRYEQTGRGMNPDRNGAYFAVDEVLTALTAAMDPALSERAGELARSDDPKVMLYHGEYVEALRALLAQNAALRAERDSAIRGRDSWRDDYKALSAAIVGDTGLSAMTVATQARLFRPRAEAAETALAAERAKVEKLRGALRDIDALDPEAGHIGACSENAIRGLVLRMGERARAALSATTEADNEPS